MGCGYINGKEHLFGSILLRKAYEASSGVNVIWKIELGEPLTKKDKTSLTKLLAQPGLEEAIREEFNWIKFEDPKPSNIMPAKIFSGKHTPKELEEVKKYLNGVSQHYLYSYGRRYEPA